MRGLLSPELLVQAKSGDRTALDRLLELIWPDAYHIAYGIVQDAGLAQDAAQEACAALCNAIGGLRDLEAFRPWFYRIVVRAGTRIAKMRTRTAELDERNHYEDVPVENVDVERALAALTPSLRAAVILHFYCGLNSFEIASILRIPAPTVRFRLSVAKRRLRPLLEVRMEVVT